jgi:hypothetical protein
VLSLAPWERKSMSAWPLGGKSISWRHRARSTEIDSVRKKESASGKRSLSLTTLFVGGGIFAATLVCPASAQTPRVTDDWVTLRPPGGGLRVLMPPDWRQETPRAPNVKLSFIDKDKEPGASGRPGHTNCTVIDGVNPDTANYTQAAIDADVFNAPAPPEVTDAATSIFQNVSLRANRVVRVSNQLAWFISYSGSYESLNAKIYSVTATVALMRPGRDYSVTCGASDTTPQRAEAAWNAWQPILMLRDCPGEC